MPKNNEMSAGSVFALCKYCGSLYLLEPGKDDPGNCGKKSCIEIANNSRVVSTQVHGTNINIITYDDSLLNQTENDILNNEPNMFGIPKNVDTTEKDLKNAKKIKKEITKRHGKEKETSKKEKRTGTTKKAKSGRVSRKSK